MLMAGRRATHRAACGRFYTARHRVKDQVKDDPAVQQVDPCINFDFGARVR